MDKSIDLGKLQNDVTTARKLVFAADAEVARANGVYHSAIAGMERAATKKKKADENLDKATRAMLEAARSVANNS